MYTSAPVGSMPLQCPMVAAFVVISPFPLHPCLGPPAPHTSKWTLTYPHTLPAIKSFVLRPLSREPHFTILALTPTLSPPSLSFTAHHSRSAFAIRSLTRRHTIFRHKCRWCALAGRSCISLSLNANPEELAGCLCLFLRAAGDQGHNCVFPPCSPTCARDGRVCLPDCPVWRLFCFRAQAGLQDQGTLGVSYQLSPAPSTSSGGHLVLT